ncbi:MAG TPA: hypothetical protein VKP58_04250 [Candidatus Acidoferrum sp.]|nr:hypothetical protein [Candidatus Acidoferrum sp.]
MGHLHIPLSGDVPIKDILSDMPAAPKALLRRGFSVVAKLPESAYSAILETVLTNAGRQSRAEEEQLAKDLNISVDEATSAVVSLAMFSALASTGKETVEQVLQGLLDSGLVSTAEKPALLRILPKVTQIKPELSKAVATRRLTDAVLPSFDDFEAVVDIRIGDQEKGGFAVPMAVALLDTDARDQKVWFQMTKQDVEILIEKLNQVLKRLKEAEELIAKFPPPSERG